MLKWTEMKNIQEIIMPSRIGIGLAGGSPREMRQMLERVTRMKESARFRWTFVEWNEGEVGGSH